MLPIPLPSLIVYVLGITVHWYKEKYRVVVFKNIRFYHPSTAPLFARRGSGLGCTHAEAGILLHVSHLKGLFTPILPSEEWSGFGLLFREHLTDDEEAYRFLSSCYNPRISKPQSPISIKLRAACRTILFTSMGLVNNIISAMPEKHLHRGHGMCIPLSTTSVAKGGSS